MVQLSNEFRKRPSFPGKVLSPSSAELAKKFGIMRDEEILKRIVQFVERFGRAGELAENISWNLYRVAHDELPRPLYRKME